MKISWLVGLVVIALANPVVADEVLDVTGTWTAAFRQAIQPRDPKGDFTMTITGQTPKGRICGAWSGKNSDGYQWERRLPRSARLEGNALTWKTAGGSWMAATLEDGSMHGRFGHTNYEPWVFTASRTNVKPTAKTAVSRHWLVGLWEGTLQGNPRTQGPRFLHITSVGADGVVHGTWGVSDEAGEANIRLTDSRVHIVNYAKSTIDLNRDGDDRFVGTLTSPDGTVFPVTFVKQASEKEEQYISRSTCRD
jgi:hypothetical protein